MQKNQTLISTSLKNQKIGSSEMIHGQVSWFTKYRVIELTSAMKHICES